MLDTGLGYHEAVPLKWTAIHMKRAPTKGAGTHEDAEDSMRHNVDED
jgi:hypothetical protein